jgi:large subunit ribosomal protein L31
VKANIHPTYYPDAKVTCASCGTSWTTGSTKKELRVDICSNCHPFFTGEASRILDIEGQVDRFYKKLSARQTYVEQQKVKEELKGSPERPSKNWVFPLARWTLSRRPVSRISVNSLRS